MTKRSILGAAALWMCVSGCRHDEPVGAKVEPARAEPAGGPSARVERERRLAMLPPAGGSPVDQLIRELQARATANPAKVDLWVALGRAWARKAREAADPGYYRYADGCAEVALDLDAESSLALDLRGLVLLNDHRFAEARALAEAILARRPDDVMAHGTLSDALLELGRFDEAAAAAQRMVELKPNLPSYSRAAYLRWLQGDGRTAREIWRLAIDSASAGPREPEPRAWALTQAAQLFWHEGDYGGAEAGFDLALVTFADYPPALVGKGRLALGRGEAKRAVELLERAHRSSPLVETAWLLGDARRLAGDAAGAQQAYDLVVKQGRRIDPRTLSLFLSTHDRDPALALELAEEEKRTRGDVYTDDALAWARFRAGRLPEARVAADAALRLGTKDARLLYHAGAIHLASGDAAGGRRLIREALARNPRFDVAGAADASRLLLGG